MIDPLGEILRIIAQQDPSGIYCAMGLLKG